MAYIYAYAPDEDDCSTIGRVGALLDEDAEFNLKAGEFGELTFTHPVDPYGKWKALVNGAILKTMVPMRLCPGLKEDGTYVAAVDRYAVSATATKAQRYLYSGSGLSGSGKKKALLKVGQVVTVTGVADASDGNSRYKVKLGKVSGWMERAGLTRTQRNVPVEQDEGGLESAEPSYAVRQQLFRIYEVNPQTGDSDPGSVEVRARRIVYDLLGNLSTYKNNGSLTCRTACENVLRSAVMPHDFTIFTDIGDSHVGFDAMNVNPIAALIDPEDGVAARWGAEIVCDDYEIYVLRRAGLDRGVRIEYAKNLIGVDVREDVSGVATAIRPAGEDKSGNPLYIGGSVVDGRHVYNGGTALPDGLRFYTAPDGAVNGAIVVRDGYDSDSPPRIHFEAVGDARVGKGSGDVTVAIARQMLVERAAALFDGGCDVPEIRMRVDFVMLGDTAEYAQYKHLEPLFVYDTVHIHDRRVGVRADIDLTELTWLVRPERVSAAEFGALKDMTASVSGWQISSVSGAKILPGTVGAGQVGDGAISARAIQADSVNADAIQAESVTAGKVAAGAITAEKLSAGAVTADKFGANAVTAAKIDANEVDAINAKLGTAAIAQAEIGSADIGFAQIKDANVEQLIARDAVTGRYYIRKLQVDNAQMVQATVGALVIKAGDGKYYRLDFDSSGNLIPTEVTLTQGEIAAGETADGRGSIIETDLTVQDLAAANMKGVNALIDTLTAGRLYANQAFIDKLWTSESTAGSRWRSSRARRP
ncbi:MAG: phage tail protein [Clostridia bacterium]|nr:phage tail protein [Clostridia bacterium]